ncbi:MAG TPA: APC family permease [Steroidobacteraceae bacterium]|nr:APC family permease [Steroidobacteraceae bacterium]
MSLEQFGYQDQLDRALTLSDLIVYGMIFMVPIAPFSVFGFVWHDARGMVALAYLIGLAGMLFTALSYAAMSQAFPLAGSVYAYVQRGLHEFAGFLAGWLILLDYILVPALLYLFSAVALQPILPAVPAWAWLAGFVSFNAAANLLGIRFTARLYKVLLALELLTLALFVVFGAMALHAGAGAGGLTLAPLYDPRDFSLSTVAGATSIAVLSFLGFDGISTLSEESAGARDAIARATLLSLVLIGALFVLQTWIAADLARGMRFSSAATAFYQIAARAGGPALSLTAILAVVISFGIANAMAAQAAVARVLFAMARDRKLPAVLAAVHPRFKTPYVSTLLVAGVSLLVGLLFTHRIDDLTRVVNFGALTSFALLHLAVAWHHVVRQRSGAWMRHLVFPLTGLAVILYVLYGMDRNAKVLGGCWIAAGIVYYLVLAARTGRGPRRPGEHAPSARGASFPQ